MKRLIFTGVVHPQRAWLSLPEIVIPLYTADGDKFGQAIISIQIGQILAVIESDQDLDEVLTIRNMVLSLAQDYINIYDYAKGYAHQAEIVQCMKDSMHPVLFGIDVDSIGSIADPEINETFLSSLLHLTNHKNGVFIRRCLDDLSMAIRRPVDTGFYISRSMESLCRFVESRYGIVNEKKQWEYLGKKLGHAKKDIEDLKIHGKNARHGRHIAMSSEERSAFLAKAYKVVDDFITWQLRENKIEAQLPVRHP